MKFIELSYEEYLSSPNAVIATLQGKEYEYWFQPKFKEQKWETTVSGISSEDAVIEYCLTGETGPWQAKNEKGVWEPFVFRIRYRAIQGTVDYMFVNKI